MSYILEICKAGKIIEVSKYHTYRYNTKEGKRTKKSKETSVSQMKINLRQAATKLRRIMNANFCDDDFLIELDYIPKFRPKDSTAMQDNIRSAMKIIRARYKKQGVRLKYIYVKELGPKGAAHIHMIISSCDNMSKVLKEAWPYGGIHIDPLNTDGQYEKIANYFIKYADKTIQTEGKLIGKKWYPSRNLDKPEVTKKVIRRVNTYYENIKEAEGYYLEKDSVLTGITADGYGYFTYTLHQGIPDDGGDEIP